MASGGDGQTGGQIGVSEIEHLLPLMGDGVGGHGHVHFAAPNELEQVVFGVLDEDIRQAELFGDPLPERDADPPVLVRDGKNERRSDLDTHPYGPRDLRSLGRARPEDDPMGQQPKTQSPSRRGEAVGHRRRLAASGGREKIYLGRANRAPP